MTNKESIINILKQGKPLTRRELVQVIYGEHKQSSIIQDALNRLLKNGVIVKNDTRPAYFSLNNSSVIEETTTYINKMAKQKNINKNYLPLSDKLIASTVLDYAYAKENELITNCLKKYPLNNEIEIIAMKIGLIDVTNSTNISRYKSYINVYELAETIFNIKNIDKRIEDGDMDVVVEIAKSNGRINLFSFASKYCCYHNHNFYGKDDYSIYDTVLEESLPLYFEDITTAQLKKWKKAQDYKEYNNYIKEKIQELKLTCTRRALDHYIWFSNRKNK